ncbi:phosphate/phosphite/phosphonate ABC transporter substrate-binding protein [Neptuniibacter sp.]|uniref:phosphate/phosphite/phosphonate ABC transporter substrate-binding protein n=1 Tax=Neptuniibacter sp. TaxID=1962643 RepID=UPI002627A095|nr:phosphate/phosphite/phosphonate ABC transporter substrate-binding protein [Neptuniibacter sp.]MCP4598396.1 phosphate/phosphite/phosphonate ABC transporter substrate-binding protein [Neptuniibacter sp.]
MMKKILCVMLLGFFATVTAQAETITFGIVPQQSAKKLARLWTPISSYLSEKAGVEVLFSTAQDIPTFEKRLLAGEYDMAYMNPYHYTVFQQKPGYDAIAKQRDKRIKGIVVVHKDSPIQSLTELNGQTLSFPSPAAFAASVLPRAKMEKDGINITPKYVSSHDSVYLTVSRGLFPAGGGVMRTFNNTATEARENLRILWTTPAYTPHAIAVHPRVSQGVKEKLQQALLSMNEDEQGQALLKTINFKGIETAKNKDWDDVRGLNIKLLQHLLQ